MMMPLPVIDQAALTGDDAEPHTMFVVRSPDPTASAVISELILQSDCGMLPALFGPNVKSLLGWLLQRPGNPYSSANALVIMHKATGPGVIGAMVGSLAAATRAANLRTAGQLARW
jgi:hypothetical protein